MSEKGQEYYEVQNSCYKINNLGNIMYSRENTTNNIVITLCSDRGFLDLSWSSPSKVYRC